MDFPHSIEAERAILGAIFLDNSCYEQCDRLSVDDFFNSRHRTIYGAMCETAENHKPLDFVMVGDVLEKNKQLQDAGGNEYLMSLTDGLPRVHNIGHYVNIVLEKSHRRKFILLAQAAVGKAQDETEPIGELITSTDKSLLAIESKSLGPQRIAEILPSVNSLAEKQWGTGQARTAMGLSMGMKSLDEFTTGLHLRELAIIAGHTMDGKTALLRQTVVAQMLENVPTLIFSREVSKEQLVDDFKSYIAKILPDHSRDKRKMEIFERIQYKEADEQIRNWPLWIDDDRGLHIDELRHRARRLIREHGIKLIGADYLQLFRGTGRNKTDETEYVCEGFWRLADEENVSVVALSQLSRDKDKIKRRPRLQDLKHASRIEQDGHLVAFVYRPEDANGKPTKNDEIVIAKQRHGRVGIIRVEFSDEDLTFRERYQKY